MSLVVILNNGSDIVIATDKRIIYTDVNDVVTRVDDNCRKMFFTPQQYVVTFNGDIGNQYVSIDKLIVDFIKKTTQYVSINDYIIKLRDFINTALLLTKSTQLEASVQVSGINNYPMTKELKIDTMEICDYNNQFILCGSYHTANEEVNKICESPEYINGELNMNVDYMKRLAGELIRISSKKEKGKYDVCPISSDYDLAIISSQN